MNVEGEGVKNQGGLKIRKICRRLLWTVHEVTFCENPHTKAAIVNWASFSHNETVIYSVVSIKRTGSLNYFKVFYHPELFFHVLNEIFLPPWSFFHVLNEIFALPCLLITSCLLNRYYRVLVFNLIKFEWHPTYESH